MCEHTTTRQIGDYHETLATAYLEARGFSIIERNYYAKKLGEIDIIAQKMGIVHFIEVKSAGKPSFDPVYNITPAKIRKLVNSAHYYLKAKKLDVPFCLDALIVREGKVELIENITL